MYYCYFNDPHLSAYSVGAYSNLNVLYLSIQAICD